MDNLYAKAREFALAADAQDTIHLRLLLYSLSAELLWRAVLAKINPLLLAGGDGADDRRMAIKALLRGDRGNKAVKSIPTKEVGLRCLDLVDQFDATTHAAFKRLSEARNGDLHSGADPWRFSPSPKWLEDFYLLAQQGTAALAMTLKDFLGDSTAEEAISLLQEREDVLDAKIKEALGLAKQRFAHLEEPERERRSLESQRVADAHALGYFGKACCPACGHIGILQYRSLSFGEPRIEEGSVLQEERRLPIGFSCVVCELRLIGNPTLRHVDLGEIELHLTVSSPFEFFGIDEEAIREHIDPVELLGESDREALEEGRSLQNHYADVEMQRWKDSR